MTEVRPMLTTTQVLLRLRDIEPGGKVDLSFFDLRQVDFQSQEIKQAFEKLVEVSEDPEVPYVAYVDMTGSIISGADFYGYDLSNFIMSEVDARRAVFVRSNLSDTHLDHALLDGADFRMANMFHTKLYESSLWGTNFSGANMEFAHGLGSPDTAVERLGRVSTIRDAKLPKNLEACRDQIQAQILHYRVETPLRASDLEDEDSG